MYKELSYQDMHKLFYYKNGELYHKFTRPGKKAHKKVGGICPLGYARARVGNKLYRVHRIIFMMHYGCLPQYIDHIDHNKTNNNIHNLRLATSQDNSRNRSIGKANKSGCVGVMLDKRSNKWKVYIRDKGKNIHLGYFTNKKEAINVRKEAEIKYNYHENHGK